MMSVTVQAAPFSAAKPIELFDANYDRGPPTARVAASPAFASRWRAAKMPAAMYNVEYA